MNPAIGRACASAHDSPGVGSQAVNPFTGGDGLAGLVIGTKRSPITFGLVILVGYGPFDDENERVELSFGGEMEILHELIAVFVGEERIMELYPRKAGEGAKHKVFDTGLGGAGHCDRIAITSQPRSNPQHVDFFYRGVRFEFC